MPAPTVFADYEKAKESFAALIRRALQPYFRPGDNLDLTVTVRGGKIRVQVASVSKAPDWKDVSG